MHPMEKSVAVHSFARFCTENPERHEDPAEIRIMLKHRDLTRRIIGLAIEVHQVVGTGVAGIGV